MKSFWFKFFLCFAFFFTPLIFSFAESSTGFLDGTLWYSKDKFTEGDTIEIHTALWNAESSTLSAKVEFLDGSTILGTRSVSIAPSKLADVFITWKVTAGDHAIKARIKDAKLATGDSSVLDLNLQEESLPKLFVPKKVAKPALNTASTDEVADSIKQTVNENLPVQISEPVTESITKLDTFRTDTSAKLAQALDNTKEKIKKLESESQTKDTKVVKKGEEVKKTPALPRVDKPIAYVEKFFLAVLLFLFKTSVVFYLLCGVIVFLVLRFIYRKIRR